MKRLLVALTLLFVSLNFVACAQKKESKTRLTQGRTSGVTGTPNGTNQTINYGWDDLNRGGPQQVYLNSQNPDQSARGFLSTFSDYDASDYGYFDFNSVAMRLTFQGGRIVSANTRLGMRFWDRNTGEPVGYLAGTEVGSAASGTKTGNFVTVEFNDGGGLTVEGSISNGTFIGTVKYDGGKVLGNFSVPANQSIYGY